jgi:hypothetical protein
VPTLGFDGRVSGLEVNGRLWVCLSVGSARSGLALTVRSDECCEERILSAETLGVANSLEFVAKLTHGVL